MFIGYDFKDTTKMNALVDGLLGWITYLDTMSMGKTSDFINALNMMGILFRNSKFFCIP